MSDLAGSNLDQPTRPATARLASLDGWRAVCIVMVLGEHSERVFGFPQRFARPVGWIFDGDLGVRFFFVISGFLITYLLLREHEKTNRIDLKKFYARRALRILPVYWAFLLVVGILQVSTPWSQRGITWVGNVTFLTNFLPGNWPTGHLWSLAVEEQFYLLWPFLLSLVVGAGERKIYVLLFLPLASAPLFRILAYAHKMPQAVAPLFDGHSFFLHDDSLAMGCLAATVFVKNEHAVSAWIKARSLTCAGIALALISIPHILTHLLKGGIFTVPFGRTFEAAGLVLLMVQSIVSPSLFPLLNWRFIGWIGVLSYSIYIWQQIFCSTPGDFGFANHWFTSFPGWLVAALLAATASYYCLEKPLMGLRSKLRVTKTA